MMPEKLFCSGMIPEEAGLSPKRHSGILSNEKKTKISWRKRCFLPLKKYLFDEIMHQRGSISF